MDRILKRIIGVRAGGARGAAPPPPLPPVTEIFEIFRAKRWWFGQKYSGENTLKGCQSQTWRLLSMTFAYVQDGVKVKWSNDPGICFVKAIYRLHVYRRNLRAEYYFHQQNKDRIKANEDLQLQPRTTPVETHHKNTYLLYLPWQKC